MPRSSLLRSLPAILGALVIASCSDSGVSDLTAPSELVACRLSDTAPTAPVLSGSLRSATELQLEAVWWEKKHKDQFRVSKKIGASGGTILIPETGFTMSFPAGAVAAPITPHRLNLGGKVRVLEIEPLDTGHQKSMRMTSSTRQGQDAPV